MWPARRRFRSSGPEQRRVRNKARQASGFRVQFCFFLQTSGIGRTFMQRSLTLNGANLPRALSFVSGLGMMLFSWLTIDHFFAANYPESIWQGSFCDISAFFNCNSSAFSNIAAIAGVPLGFFGLLVGALVSLGA